MKRAACWWWVRGPGMGHGKSESIDLSGLYRGFAWRVGRPAGLVEKCRSWAAVQVVQVVQVLLLILLLTGCAGHVEPEIRTVRVEVPVPVPCHAPEVAVPPWAASGLRKADSLEVKVRALLAERRQRIGYERQVVAAVEACR